MKVVLELHFEDTMSVDYIEDIVNRALDAISGGGPKVQPRLLVELSPNYLEIPLGRTGSKMTKKQSSGYPV